MIGSYRGTTLRRAGRQLDTVFDEMERRNLLMSRNGDGCFRPSRPLLFVKNPRTASESLCATLRARCLDFVRVGHRQQVANFYARPEASRISVSHNHLLVHDLLRSGRLPRAEYHKRIRCAFVRNPWDRVVSFWRLWRPGEPQTWRPKRPSSLKHVKTFASFVAELWRQQDLVRRFNPNGSTYRLCHPQWRWILPDFDFIGRFEWLTEDVSAFGRLIGNDDLHMITHIKMHNESSSSRRSCFDMYDRASAEIVAELYADDIAIFGYRDVDEGASHSVERMKENLAEHWARVA